MRVATSDIYVTFVGVCFAFVNICQKRKKEKRMKMGFGFHSKVIYGKSGILVCDFLVSCDSRVGPVSQTAIVQIFHVGTAKTLYSIRSCFATGAQNTLHRQQKKERIKVNHL